MAMPGLLPKLLPPSIISQRRWLSHRRPPPVHHATTRIRSSSDSSTTTTPATTTTSPAAVKLTYLEFNGWLWELPGGFRVLVDPILVGNLDFGIPWLFDAAKKTLPKALRADVLITPVVKQLLPADFTLVSGQEDAVELARLLRPTYVVPMSNGEFDAKGILAALVSTRGTIQAFRAMLADALPDAKVVEPTPGVPLHLRFDDNDNNNNSSTSSSSSS
uniref:Uncharacterized protein n=1 Tax=Aegilops tauschii TaxID=37682 RepID=M8ANB9_AEGTA